MKPQTLLTRCSVLISLTALAAPALAEVKPLQTDFFPVSAWYSGGKARAPMLSDITPQSRTEWLNDLQQIKGLGFNTVRTWVEWAHCEPREGEFHFENLKLLCELAQEAGLRVIVQIYGDSAPDWVGVIHKDSEYEAQSGAKVPSQAAPGYCSDKPAVGTLLARFYTETAKVANQYPNLHAYDLWSEPHIINWAIINYVPDAQFCFCPYTREKFRNWLEKKYGDVTGINKAWYRNFNKLSEVDPPRFGTILSYTDFIDWKSFIYEKLAEDMKLRYDAVRKADQEHVITSHAAVPSIFGSPFNGDGASDDFLMAEQLEFYGTSLYPKHSIPKTHWPRWQFNVAVDFERSANLQHGGFYVGELQAGFGVRGVVVGDPVTADDHRVWLWSVIARGAKAVNFYAYYPMSSSYESGGYGLIELDGKITDRARQTGKTAQIVDKNHELILGSKPQQAKVALLYNTLSQMVGGEQNSGPQGGLRDSLIGYYRALAEAGIPVDFVHRKQLEAGLPEQYKLLILPYPIMFTDKAADGVRKFAECGGYVVTEARLAWNDERGAAREVVPGMGLAELFGVRESKVKMADSVPMKLAAEGSPLIAGLASQSLKGSFFMESLTPADGAKVLATFEDNSPAIVLGPSGRTLAIGSFLGLGTHPTPNVDDQRFIRNMVTWAGIEPRLAFTVDKELDLPLEAVLRDTPDGHLLFVINPAADQQAAHITVRPAQNGTFESHNLITDEVQKLGSGSPLKIDVTLAAKQVAVLQLKRAQ
jgi:beta-galactosidase GanA